jgi:hypothetical protein
MNLASVLEFFLKILYLCEKSIEYLFSVSDKYDQGFLFFFLTVRVPVNKCIVWIVASVHLSTV